MFSLPRKLEEIMLLKRTTMLLDMYNNIGKNQSFLNFHLFPKKKI